ncbi:hypothetical protein CBL_08522 [Carabus blaptoides fortunei]
MEKALSLWIDDCCQKKIPLDGSIIKQKTLKIYKHLKENGESSVSSDFVASKGWFEKFKKRFAIHSIKVQGESASADHEAARTYAEKIKKNIEEHGYTPNQVFNAEETDLWWKKMPNITFISKQEKCAPGFKASKDRITLLLCSNASGDFITKPFLVQKLLNPRALKGVNKNTLPVHWKANSKAWVTGNLFREWFLESFVPEVENYLKEKNLGFKVLLLLDNAPGHQKDLSHPNIQVEFLPPNTTFLIQPLDQGIIYTFKSNYIRRSLQWILNLTELKSITIMEVWKQFSIKHCIEIISLSLKELKTSTLNACWKKIWALSVGIENDRESSENEIVSILNLGRTIGGEVFDDMNMQDVQDLFMEEEIAEEHLLEMASVDPFLQIDNDKKISDEDYEIKELNLKKLQEGINLAKNLEFFLNADECAERSLKFKRKLEECLFPYQTVYNDLLRNTKQTKITDVLKRAESANDITDSESEDDINIKSTKRLHLVVSSSDEEENH